MKRTEYKKHPNNVSSVLWNWAAIIIHDLFWTDYRDMSKSKTSSYLDMSPLYGSNQEMQDTIRTFKDGKLKPDCFADKRILGMPPGVGVILIMFNRFHNNVAEKLAAINEDGRFAAPAADLEGEKKEAAWKKYDNDIFQTARLITSGLYINITLVDYVRNIVNVSPWSGLNRLMPADNPSLIAWTRSGHWIPASTPALTSAPTRGLSAALATLCLLNSTCVTAGTRASPRRTTSGFRTSTMSCLASKPRTSPFRISSVAFPSSRGRSLRIR